MLAKTHIALYESNGDAALAALTAQWPDLTKSLLLRIQLLRIDARFMRARALLAAAASGSDSRLLRAAEREARKLAKESVGYGNAYAAAISAGAAAVRGDHGRVATLYARTEELANRADLSLLAIAARRARGLVTGADGTALVADADAWTAKLSARLRSAPAELLPSSSTGRTLAQAPQTCRNRPA